MSISWGAVVALIYIIIHVVSYLAKESAKRKERERKMETTERERIAVARAEPPVPAIPGQSRVSVRWGTGAAQSPTSPLPANIRVGRSVDELADRRKQQVEQLRARAGLKAGPASTSAPRTPGAINRAGAGLAMPTSSRQDRPETHLEQAQADQQAARIRAEKVARAEQQRSATAQQQRQQTAKRDAQQLQTKVDDQTRRKQPEQLLRPIAAGTRTASHSLLKRLKNRATLRELIVLKEIIDPPVAMRNQSA